MRGNCDYLKWALPRKTIIIVICIICLLQIVKTGPTVRRPRRMIREIELNSYHNMNNNNSNNKKININSNETDASASCLMDGSRVIIATVTCEKKPGCRAIQKTGECCPEYQCECERDGRIYVNGEKLVDPNTPCRVCYCQGGEISCNAITCYIRNDCEPKYIQGRCCPEYDNCPPLERIKVQQQTFKENSSEANKQKVTESISFTEASTGVTPTSTISMPDNPLGIKIKEITKPEEIRITDYKPKSKIPIKDKQVLVASSPSNEDVINSETVITNPSNKNDLSQWITTEGYNKLDNAYIFSDGDSRESAKNVRHTSIINTYDINDLNTTDSSEFNHHEHQNTNDFTSTTQEDIDWMSTSLSPLSSSSDYEVSSKPNLEIVEPDYKPASVLHIGDKVVIVDHSGQSKPITLYGVEGLIRGEPDEAEFSNTKHSTTENTLLSTIANSYASSTESPDIENSRYFNSKNESSEVLTNLNAEDQPLNSDVTESLDFNSSTTEFNFNEYSTAGIITHEQKSTDGQDYIASSSDNFFQILSTANPLHLNENKDSKETKEFEEKIYTPVYYGVVSDGFENEKIYEPVYYSEIFNGTTLGPDNDEFSPSIKLTPSHDKSENNGTNQDHIDDEDQPNSEQHSPEYPPLPEDIDNYSSFSGNQDSNDDFDAHHHELAKGQNVLENKTTDSDKKNLIDPFFHQNNISSTQLPIDNETNKVEWLKERSMINEDAALPDNILLTNYSDDSFSEENDTQTSFNDTQLRSPGEPWLVPEWERTTEQSEENSTMTTVGPLHNAMVISTKNISIEEDEDDEGNSDIGSGIPEKEPTTKRTVDKLLTDIDDLDEGSNISASSGDQQYSPKDEVESVKLEYEETSSSGTDTNIKTYNHYLESNSDIFLNSVGTFFKQFKLEED